MTATAKPEPTSVRKSDPDWLRMGRIMRELKRCGEPELVYLRDKIGGLLDPTLGAPSEG